MNKRFNLPCLRHLNTLKLVLDLIVDALGNELGLLTLMKIPIERKHELTNLLKKILLKIGHRRSIPNNLPIGILIDPALVILL